MASDLEFFEQSGVEVKETFLGGCFLGTRLVQCSWTAAGCGDLYTFVSSRQMPKYNICQDNHRQYSGMCLDETLCTSDASNCLYPNSYAVENPFCNIEYNFYAASVAGDFHLSGTCELNGVKSCVFSASNCENGIFTKPGEAAYNSGCTCDKTKVGACKNGDDYTCAISADGCDAESEFVEWFNLGAAVDCRLCNGFKKETRHWRVPTYYDRVPQSSNNSIMESIGLGILIGVIVVSFIAVVYGGCCRRRSAPKEMTAEAPETEMPTVA